MWRRETKKNYSIIMSAPCRHKTAPRSPFSPCCSAEFEMAQARRFSITSLKGLFLWFNSPVATMAFISLCLTFLGFILFLSPQSSSLGCVSPTPQHTPSELAIPEESSVPWIWTLKPRTRELLLIFLLACLWKSWGVFFCQLIQESVSKIKLYYQDFIHSQTLCSMLLLLLTESRLFGERFQHRFLPQKCI